MGVQLPLSEHCYEQSLAEQASKEMVKWDSLSGFANMLLNNFPHPELSFRQISPFSSFKRAY